jgi:serine/threonine-protein kinase
MIAQDAHPKKGEVLAGKYQVEEILGAGGMGVVVAARHVALRQRVALKFLVPAATRMPGAAARFLREAQAAAAIQSEHVARVLDVGTLANGAPYMVMEHLSGVDLARHLKERGSLSLEDTVDFVLQASEALAEAHSLGIVHRDLKPGNLFLTRRPEGSPLVKVLDFGLSKVVLGEEDAPDTSLTATNVVAGSPHYMSPEQVRSLKHVDARTDVWALGVILYELLTGKRPFEGNTVTALCAAVAADTPPPARVLRPDIPQAVETLISACMEKDPSRRLPTVAHLAVGLAPFAPKRSETSIERIRLLLPGAPAPADKLDVAVTVQLPDRPSRPQGVPSERTPFPGHSPAPPRAELPSNHEGLQGFTPPFAAVQASPVLGVPPVSAPTHVPAARASHPSAPSFSAAPVSGTGPVGWAGTQPPSRRSNNAVLIAGAAMGLVLAAIVVGFVVLRGRVDPAAADVAPTALAAAPSAEAAPSVTPSGPAAPVSSAPATTAEPGRPASPPTPSPFIDASGTASGAASPTMTSQAPSNRPARPVSAGSSKPAAAAPTTKSSPATTSPAGPSSTQKAPSIF